MSADLFSVLLIHQRSPPGGPPLPEVRPCRFHPHSRPDPIASTSIEPMAMCRPDHPAMGISSPRHQYSWWRVLASACGLGIHVTWTFMLVRNGWSCRTGSVADPLPEKRHKHIRNR